MKKKQQAEEEEILARKPRMRKAYLTESEEEPIKKPVSSTKEPKAALPSTKVEEVKDK